MRSCSANSLLLSPVIATVPTFYTQPPTIAVAIRPPDTFEPTITIPPTFTPNPDVQIPPPGTTLHFGEYYSKSGISVSIDSFYYSFKEIMFEIHIRNDRSVYYLFRFYPNVFSATDNLGRKYKAEGSSVDKLRVITVPAQDSYTYQVFGTTWSIYGEISPDVTQLFFHATELGGMHDLTWVYDF